MKKEKDKKVLKIIRRTILILAIILIILIEVFAYKAIQKNKFKNILSENDSTNYLLIQTSGEDVTTVKVYGTIMISETDDNLMWISEEENMRVIIDKNYETAIVTKNPDDALTVASLNETYINDYFENSSEKFKYIGEENGIYEIQFTNKSTGIVTYLYINKETGIVEKIIEDFGSSEVTIDFDVTVDCVTIADVEVPDLTEIYTEYSSNSNVEGDSTDYIEEEEEETDENIVIIETEE